MEVEAAKMIGAGLAVIALAGVGVGIGNIFSALVTSIARNPAARSEVFGIGILRLCADRSYRTFRTGCCFAAFVRTVKTAEHCTFHDLFAGCHRQLMARLTGRGYT